MNTTRPRLESQHVCREEKEGGGGMCFFPNMGKNIPGRNHFTSIKLVGAHLEEAM